LSLEDDLMRIFGSERISGLMSRVGMEEGVPIEHSMVSRAIERAQKQVEGQNFSIRKHLLEYDDVMNKQRTSIYSQRRDILEGKDMRNHVLELVATLGEWIMENYTNQDISPDEWDVEGFKKSYIAQFGQDPEGLGLEWETVNFEELKEKAISQLRQHYEEKERLLGPATMREFERMIMLQVIDTQWKDHLLGMDYLKEGIGLRGYGQRDPLVEYKKESFDMYQAMMDRIEEETIRFLYFLQPAVEESMPVRRARPVTYGERPQQAPAPRAKQARSVIPKKRKKKKKKR
ncbi:MAG: preprotein translocase subunit SecA, partial [Deltaproteobacteria bacterium]|nr:preprotein translocase subunit SecA [Deltaproteobacteria bacterium]